MKCFPSLLKLAEVFNLAESCFTQSNAEFGRFLTWIQDFLFAPPSNKPIERLGAAAVLDVVG